MDTLVENIIGSVDQKNSRDWRDEDIAFRHQEMQWKFDDLQRDKEWRDEDIRRIKIQVI
jgi:hypothetical protein